jgi:hypothetical protein
MATPTALAQFRANLGAVRALLRLERRYIDPPAPAYVAIVKGLRGGAAVLVVASFEDFLSRLTEEVLERISDPAVDFSRLPNRIQAQSVFATLEQAMAGEREKHRRLPDIAQACTMVLDDRVNPRVFGLTRHNPDARAVRDLFKNIGIPNVFDRSRGEFDKRWRTQTHATFPADKLNEIVNRRHLVAHTASALNVTRTDLQESLRFIDALGSALRATAHGHMATLRRKALKPRSTAP